MLHFLFVCWYHVVYVCMYRVQFVVFDINNFFFVIWKVLGRCIKGLVCLSVNRNVFIIVIGTKRKFVAQEFRGTPWNREKYGSIEQSSVCVCFSFYHRFRTNDAHDQWNSRENQFGWKIRRALGTGDFVIESMSENTECVSILRVFGERKNYFVLNMCLCGCA